MSQQPLRPLIAALALTAACGSSGAPATPSDATVAPIDVGAVDAGAALIEPGTGQALWEPLRPSGNRVELVYGAQGGYHVWGRARFRDLGPDVRLSFRLTPVEGGDPLNDPAADTVRLREGRGLLRVGENQWETSSPQLVVLKGLRTAEQARMVVGRRYNLEFTVQRFKAPERASVTVEVEIVDEV